MTFSLRPAAEADLARVVEIFNTQAYEPTSLEQSLRIERNRRTEDPFLRLVAAAPDGKILGYGIAGSGPGVQPGEFSMTVRVEAPYQGHGIGGTLFSALTEWALGQGARSFRAGVDEVYPEAVAWAERQGFVKAFHIFNSKLALPEWDAGPFQSVVEQARSAGFRFTDFAAEATGEATYRRFYDLIGPVMDDLPGAAGRVRAPYERWRSNIDQDPNWDPHGILLAVDGERWVAFAVITRLPGGALINGFTGVVREYRGRGLALAVKVIALAYAKTLGAPYITTNNHSVNAPMLAVNRKLGYQPSPGSFTLKKLLG